MRILLDENVREAFATFISGHQVDHVDRVGLKSVRNGRLLEVARQDYDAFVTLDRGILYEHNHDGQALIIAVLRVPNSILESLRLRLPALLEFLSHASLGDKKEILQ